MRLQPVGRDQQGLMYWLQLDQDQNIRLYTEEQDDLDGSTWKCIVRLRPSSLASQWFYRLYLKKKVILSFLFTGIVTTWPKRWSC